MNAASNDHASSSQSAPDLPRYVGEETSYPGSEGENTNSPRQTLELTIQNKLGLHARPSAQFVKVSSRYKADIWVEKDGEQVNGKSIMGLMMLAAGHGSKLRIVAEGSDAADALREIGTLVQNRFDEE